MNTVIEWFKASNRWRHLIYGMVVGIGSNSWYCAAYAGAGIAGALEFKDWQWGGKWDWVDFSLTVVGVMAGYMAQSTILTLIQESYNH